MASKRAKSEREPSLSPEQQLALCKRALREYLETDDPKLGHTPTWTKQQPALAPIRAADRATQAVFFEHVLEFVCVEVAATRKGERRNWADPTHDKAAKAASSLAILISRKLPLSMDTVARFIDAYRADALAGCNIRSAVMRIAENAIGSGQPSAKLRAALIAWRKEYRDDCPDDFTPWLSHINRVIDLNSAQSKSAALRIASAKELTGAIKMSFPAILAGEALNWKVEPATLPRSPAEALNLLTDCNAAMTDWDGSSSVHLARFVLERPAFASTAKTAPALSEALRTLFHRSAKVPDAALAEVMLNALGGSRVRNYEAFRRDQALKRIVETMWLSGYDLPITYAKFTERMYQENRRTDVPRWGDWFEPVEDEADRGDPFILLPGDAWTNLARSDLRSMRGKKREHWLALLRHVEWFDHAKPSAKWLKVAGTLCEPIAAKFPQRLASWLSLFGSRGTRRVNLWAWPEDPTIPRYGNNRTLRGLLWCVTTPPIQPTRELLSAIASAGVAGDEKVIRLGPRCAVVRNAAMEVLSAIKSADTAPFLGIMSTMMKYRAGKSRAAAVVGKAAAARGMTAVEFAERTLPDFEFDANGTRTIKTAAGPLVLRIAPPGELHGTDSLRPVPKECSEIRLFLSAQRLRIERLLSAPVQWPLADWVACYGNHPIISSIARSLIWNIDGVAALWDGKTWTGATAAAVKAARTAVVTPWHPAIADAQAVLAWRQRLEAEQFRQPFSQAHRQIYRLTEAERRTGTYSNRFASHILAGPQFKALLHQRQWDGDPAMRFDVTQPDATFTIAHAGLTATFHTLQIESDDDVAMSAFVTTDRVEFARSGTGERVELADVPPLVFSEIMRDVDLFIGVCSVGNNPNWSDGGPGHQFRDYWNDYSFGDLSETALGRRELLGRLLPRLQLADVCKISGRFLIVKGTLRTYKIHFGSGNILMEPNDEYLCIVPVSRDQRAEAIHLPFDGDQTLAVILSKAFMLAEDDRIKDRTILSQIR